VALIILVEEINRPLPQAVNRWLSSSW